MVHRKTTKQKCFSRHVEKNLKNSKSPQEKKNFTKKKRHITSLFKEHKSEIIGNSIECDVCSFDCWCFRLYREIS